MRTPYQPRIRTNTHRFDAHRKTSRYSSATSIAYRTLSRVGGKSDVFGSCGVGGIGVEAEAAEWFRCAGLTVHGMVTQVYGFISSMICQCTIYAGVPRLVPT